MELANIYIGNSLDSKSSLDLIQFIPFNNDENKCYYCKVSYSKTLLFHQKYCKYCLMLYIKHTDNDNLDVLIGTNYSINSQCREHEPGSLDFCTQNIQEWCNSCSEILCFKQIVTNNKWDYFYYYVKKYFEKIKNCKLCGKSVYYQECLDDYIELKLCSDCYQISFEWVESTLIKKVIPILYLPWWDAYDRCATCDKFLESKSNCQKLCSDCKIIYTGCRYCLTTNIIFGITDQSQCKKCKRMISITIDITNGIEDESFISTKINKYNYNQIANYINRKNSNQLEIYNCISSLCLPLKPLIDLVSYFQITDLENIEDYSNSIIPIMFIPFNNDENECYYCKRSYSTSLLFKQKYCKHCFMLYIKYTVNDNLDLCICNNYGYYFLCNRKHEPRSPDFCTQNIQEWCNSCSEILCFKQIVTNNRWTCFYYEKKYAEKVKNCKLCGKSVYYQECLDDYIELKLCSDCYQISFEWVESTLIKKVIPILYLPWWDAYDRCATCDKFLKSKSNCQKLCSDCKIIYTGCRFCLTTNIIFGITDQSQCKKCKRMIFITIDITNGIENESFISTKINNYNYNQIANYTNRKNSNQLEIYNFISRLCLPLKPLIDLVSYFQITDLENIEDYSNSIIPIMFIPFNNDENECYYCKRSYSTTLLFKQKYCKHCLMLYIKYTVNDNLDVCICTNCHYCISYSRKHESKRSLDFCTQNIKEWCNSCSGILCFKQIVTNNSFYEINDVDYYRKQKLIENEKDCKLCGKSIYQQECLNKPTNYIEFKLCLDCYQISSGWIESTLTEKSIPILYLPWWDAYNRCVTCDKFLKSKSNCQKLCSDCKIIYTGCRYCLTTNIIFGITDQSQCKKCKRMIFITIDITNGIEDESFISTKINNYNYNQIANYTNRKNSNQLEIYNFISRLCLPLKPLIDLVSYFQITDLENIEDYSNSIIPIMFIPFNNDENECYYCKRSYSTTLLFKQKYCKHCLMLYIKYTVNDNLDVCICTNCHYCISYSRKHEPKRSLDFCTQNIKEWCNSCSEILCFKQIVTNNRFYEINNVDYYRKQKLIENEKDCKLCGKSIYQQEYLNKLTNYIEFKLCLDCYQISSGWIESTLTEKSIPILYLPWWDASNQCVTCDKFLNLNLIVKSYAQIARLFILDADIV